MKPKTKIIAFRVSDAEHRQFKKSKKLTASVLRSVISGILSNEVIIIDASFKNQVKIKFETGFPVGVENAEK